MTRFVFFLAGQVSGLHAVVLALANTHPDPSRLGKELEEVVQAQLALTTPLPLSERFFDGQENTIKGFTNRIGELAKGK